MVAVVDVLVEELLLRWLEVEKQVAVFFVSGAAIDGRGVLLLVLRSSGCEM